LPYLQGLLPECIVDDDDSGGLINAGAELRPVWPCGRGAIHAPRPVYFLRDCIQEIHSGE
jgi:hypothetical protein